MKRLGITLTFIFVGVFSFLFFLYFTFPYEVLKEAIAMKASEESGLNIQLGELGPSFPFGLEAEKVKVTSPGGHTLHIHKADVNVSLLNLLLGKLAVELELTDEKKGVLDFQVKISLLKLLLRQGSLPNSIYLQADKFVFGKLIDFALNNQAQDPSVNVMLKPWLESVDVDGQLSALVDLSINEGDLSKSVGQANFSFDNTVIKSLNANLPIPDQRFSKALLKADLQNGILTIDKNSGLISQDLAVAFNGKIVQKPDLLKSQLDLDVGIEMGEPLMEQFGFVLNALINRDTQGRLQIKITGALTPQPNITIL